MPADRAERRLAAILAADVVGYGRLMEANEEATMTALKAHRREVLDPAVADHGGRLFKAMGDGFLVEFPSVVAAMRCALDVQRAMHGRNAGLPEDRHIRFRIGLNLGDLIVDGDDFYGDGLNLAARIEGLAQPGGIACSAIVRDQVGNRLDVTFADMGERTVKNVTNPVRVFTVEPSRSPQDATPAAQTRRDRPSVAVLPFANMSNDLEQEFFSDGITEDLITDLSNVSGLFVIGRNTVFAYKGRAVDLEETARKLGVDWIVEGSVRKAGNRVRITAQLIEGTTGGHVWAARYDRDLTDIFEVQDEITTTIVDQLKVKLLPSERRTIRMAPTDNVDAYTCYWLGRKLWYHGTKEGAVNAKRMFAHAAALDPDYALAYVGMAHCASTLASIHGVPSPADDILRLADRAVALKADLAEAHAARGFALLIGDRLDEALAALKRSLSLNPDCIDAHDLLARSYVTIGQFGPAADHYTRSLELQPEDFQGPLMLRQVLVSLGRHDEAARYTRLGIKRAEEWMRRHPDDSKPAQMGAMGWALLGDRDRALDWLIRATSLDPDDNLSRYNAACTYALLGEYDRSIELLRTYLPLVSKDARIWFLRDSDLDPIRNHPGYKDLLSLVG